ncbi:MAG: hypothetical protein KFW09_03230 [Oscillospiraceae bacterium]|nr:hypothetical protein [Oscillospiraceae bacterium]
MPIKILDRILRINNNSTKVGEYKGPGNPKYPDFKAGVNMIKHPPIDQCYESVFPYPTGKRDTLLVLTEMQQQAEQDNDWTASGLLQLDIQNLKLKKNSTPIPAPTPDPIPIPKEPTLKERFLAFFGVTNSVEKPKKIELSDDELEDQHFKELELAGPYIKRDEALKKEGFSTKADLLDKPDAVKKTEDEKREYQEKIEREEARCRKAVQDMRDRREAEEKRRKDILEVYGKYSLESLTFGKSAEEIKDIKRKAKKQKLDPKRYLLQEQLKESVANDLAGMGITNLK